VFEDKIEESEPKGDLISREQAIRSVYWDAEAMEVLEQLPSAERKGKWKISNLPKDKILRYCSECGWGINLNDNRKYGYCPNCGAKMKTLRKEMINNGINEYKRKCWTRHH